MMEGTVKNDSKLENEAIRYNCQYDRGVIIGKGGFGTVYAGKRVSDGLPVALKHLQRKQISNWCKVCNFAHFLAGVV